VIRALIFDVDGTLADTEDTHRRAFNAAFLESGLNWQWGEPLYSELLLIAGGKERMLRYWRSIDPQAANRPGAAETIAVVHARKTRHYEAIVRDGDVPLRPGILRLLDAASACDVQLAIATTTTPANIDALLRRPLGRDWRRRFAAVGDADSVVRKKPAPDVYRHVLGQLRILPRECLAFEDSRNGLLAADAAGIATIVTPTPYTLGQRFDEALMMVPHLGDRDHPLPADIPGVVDGCVSMATLREWHHVRMFRFEQRAHRAYEAPADSPAAARVMALRPRRAANP